MFSTIRVGDAAISVRVRARTLLGQFLLCGLALLGAAIVFLLLALLVFGSMVQSGAIVNGELDPASLARMFQSGWMTVAAIILAYLALLSAWAILSETVLGFGYWATVARNATIASPDSLRSVRATREDTALAGEGLADALNVGAY
jgi:hypothetical protein